MYVSISICCKCFQFLLTIAFKKLSSIYIYIYIYIYIKRKKETKSLILEEANIFSKRIKYVLLQIVAKFLNQKNYDEVKNGIQILQQD